MGALRIISAALLPMRRVRGTAGGSKVHAAGWDGINQSNVWDHGLAAVL